MKRQRQSEGTWSLKKPRNVNDGQKESDVAVDETGVEDFSDPSSTVEPSPRKSLYEEFFEFAYEKGVKYGQCLNCGKDSKGKFIVRYKMSGHNTSSLRTHLKSKHIEIFQKLFECKESEKKKDDQPKINLSNFFKVRYK